MQAAGSLCHFHPFFYNVCNLHNTVSTLYRVSYSAPLLTIVVFVRSRQMSETVYLYILTRRLRVRVNTSLPAEHEAFLGVYGVALVFEW